ncbi:hypothetical protein HY218_01345, partial [Candidatus Saccharibacteria bacterium]|nr:hypothetical protein [Candidatus Saccharibacteria bacterium]
FNVYYLQQHLVDKERRVFKEAAERDVLEQNLTEIAEADVHNFAPTVYQHWSPEIRQYVSLGAGTVDHACTGRDALELDDLTNWFEYYRREDEAIDELRILESETQQSMQAGGKKVRISPAPTYQEADPEVAIAFGYDDRTMITVQGLSRDGQTKIMKSYSVFEVPAKAWAALLSKKSTSEVKPTALSVMQFSGTLPLEHGSFQEVIEALLNSVKDYIPETDWPSLETQLDAFLHEQAQLEQQTLHYAHEKLELQKELACCLHNWASPQIDSLFQRFCGQLKLEDQHQLAERYFDNRLYVDEFVATLAVCIKTVTTDNRAGLATLNQRTVGRMASQIGLDATLALAEHEQAIQQAVQANIDSEFMVRRSEQIIAESGVGCGGGCSVSIVDLFSKDASTAREAGLNGTLYSSSELDKNSQCTCPKNNRKAKVVSDGKNVVCLTCGEYQTSGRRGNLKKAA